MQNNNNENIEKNSDSWGDNLENIDGQDNLKESFSKLEKELRDQLNKLKSQIKEWHENQEDLLRIKDIEKQIHNINEKIDREKTIEQTTWWEGNISDKKELKIVQQIDARLAQNPWEANYWRAQSAFKLLNDIHWKLDPNWIARFSQWIIRQLTK